MRVEQHEYLFITVLQQRLTEAFLPVEPDIFNTTVAVVNRAAVVILQRGFLTKRFCPYLACRANLGHNLVWVQPHVPIFVKRTGAPPTYMQLCAVSDSCAAVDSRSSSAQVEHRLTKIRAL